MGARTALELGDVERAIAARDPMLGEVVVRYLAQPDPEPGVDELRAGADADPDADPDADGDQADVVVPPDVPAGAFTLERLSQAVRTRGLAGKSPTERKLARQAAFAAAEASPFAPPRLRIGKLLVGLYERGEPGDRAALLHVFAHAQLGWGVWYAAKTIYKRAEAAHDAALFAALAYRVDVVTTRERGEVDEATYVYLRRRAWRYLRLLGRALPDAYTTFAVEVLRHYPAGHGNARSWVAAQIWGHGGLRGARNGWFKPPPDLAQRAFPEAWARSPAPLLRLLEWAQNDLVCDFAIRSLRADHPLALRAVEPAWLAQLARRPLPAIHGFIVQLLRDSPELHASRLRGLGLHEVVLGFLRSPSPDAQAYALEYAAAHAPDLDVDELVALVDLGAPAVKKFAAARLEQLTPEAIGAARLASLVAHDATPWAAARLAQGFGPRDLDAATFVSAALQVPRSSAPTAAYDALLGFFAAKGAPVPAGHLTALLDDPRIGPRAYQLRAIVNRALAELEKRSAGEIGIAWLQRALEGRDYTAHVARWLQAGMMSGPELDVEWLKGLVGKPRLRPIAIALLADRRRVAPAKVGLGWLLELARSSDGNLAGFAQRMLLESFEPDDFGGVARVWELATGAKQPEAVRGFAATYLKAHHPDLGPKLPEARALGIKPRLDHDAYPAATVRPLLADPRTDVRRLAVAIAGEEIVRWGEPGLVYELAASPDKEPRALGGELLLGVITLGEVRRVPAAWVDGRRLFQLAESAQKASREVALTLIRRLYEQVGGAERLAWLMDSPDRDVRLFAVRLFWDRHRPTPWPASWPESLRDVRSDARAARPARVRPEATTRFADLAALRQFARVVLFGLPPGRVGERDPGVPGAPQPERPLPASVAKRRIIEALRDIALEDVELARAVAPVLGEFSSSIAKGEWQASVQALTALRARHQELGA